MLVISCVDVLMDQGMYTRWCLRAYTATDGMPDCTHDTRLYHNYTVVCLVRSRGDVSSNCILRAGWCA